MRIAGAQQVSADMAFAFENHEVFILDMSMRWNYRTGLHAHQAGMSARRYVATQFADLNQRRYLYPLGGGASRSDGSGGRRIASLLQYAQAHAIAALGAEFDGL
jgi:hypothetical protein